MDGQKNIFFKQMQYLNHEEFQFTWVSTVPLSHNVSGSDVDKQDSEVLTRLHQLSHVKVVMSPYAMAAALDPLVIDAGVKWAEDDVPLSAKWAKDRSLMFDYISDQFKEAKGNIDDMTPLWVRKFYTLMRDHILEEKCEIIVYGNERGPSSNMLITDTAKSLGIPTVSELLNLFIGPNTVPTAIVGPSVYSIEHESEMIMNSAVLEYVNGNLTQRQKMKAAVIPPSVDTIRFNPNNVKDEDVIYHPLCQSLKLSNINAECLTIGFFARLAPEKNPGLFFLAAEKILLINPFVRFTVVGDGDLKTYLENLCSRLGILWAVHFTGWIKEEDLPRILKGLDVVVNPSLRGWSETFCIANIEAMSMGIPLVTFAVGGK